MRNFNRVNSRSGSNRYGTNTRSSNRYSSGGGFNRREESRPELFRTTCAECGMSCEVPFRPTGEKPVYCSRCFKTMGDGNSTGNRRDDRRSRNFSRDNFREEKEMFSGICDECGEQCEVPFKPTSGKPLLCSSCFATANENGSKRGNDNSAVLSEIAKLNEKVDLLLSILNPKTTKEEKKVTSEKAEKVETKKVASKKVSKPKTEDKKEVKKKADTKKPVAKKETKKKVATKKK